MKKYGLKFALLIIFILFSMFFYVKYKSKLVNMAQDTLGYLEKLQTREVNKLKPLDINFNIEEEYNLVKGSLNVMNPGFGKSDYGDYDTVDIPKAYAMFLSAELMKYQSLNGNYDLTMAINSGHWLLNNSDMNNNGITGWGVPVAWDAFGDKSVNEKNTEYTITTGIVLNSLMDWMEVAPKEVPNKEIHSIIKNAIKPYLEKSIFSDTGLFNYSLKEVDRKYNCFNAAIYMAGQMQRYTTFISDIDLKNKIKLSVDSVMDAAIKYKKVDVLGGWYWSYSVEENKIPNDLAHAGYIVDGIMTYIYNKGTYEELFDKEAILNHLEYFSNDSGSEWYFHPSFFRKSKTSPRLYGLGMILNIYSKYIKDEKK